MRNPIKKLFNQYSYFRKSDRNATIIISVLIILSFTAKVIVDKNQPKSKYNYAEFERKFNEWESNNNLAGTTERLFMFNPNTISKEELDSLKLPQFVKQNILNYRNAGGGFKSSAELRKIYGMNDSIFEEIEIYIDIPQPKITEKISDNTSNNKNTISGFFDPNSADINTLSEFGFNNFQKQNLIKYREKGGVFKTKNDLLRIYGIDSLFFARVEKHIQIQEVNEIKLPVDETLVQIELNRADSAQLVKIKGVGTAYARRILKYRDLLGGYFSSSQLHEVYNLPNDVVQNIQKHVFVDTFLLHQIRINFADYSELLRHPYLNKEEVEGILKFREKNGAFKNISQIRTFSSVDSITFFRIRPYLTCR